MALADLSPKKNAETGVEITLYNPKTNLPLRERITIYGSDSEVVRRIQRRQLNRRLERSQRTRNNKSGLTAEESEAESMDLLVGSVKEWRTILADSTSRPEIELAQGEWLPCNPENVRKVFEELPWMKEQVDQGIVDRANFL